MQMIPTNPFFREKPKVSEIIEQILTGAAKRREWMGMGVAGIIIDSYCGSFPHSLPSTSKIFFLTSII